MLIKKADACYTTDHSTMSIAALRTESTTAAKSILSSGVDTLTSLSTALSTASPYSDISSAEAAFVAAIGSDVEESNDVVDGLYKVVRDALVMGIANIRVLEKFIGLRVPQMGELSYYHVCHVMCIALIYNIIIRCIFAFAHKTHIPNNNTKHNRGRQQLRSHRPNDDGQNPQRQT